MSARLLPNRLRHLRKGIDGGADAKDDAGNFGREWERTEHGWIMPGRSLFPGKPKTSNPKFVVNPRARLLLNPRPFLAADARHDRQQRRDNRGFAAGAAFKIKPVGFDRFFGKVMIDADKLHIHAAIRTDGLTNGSGAFDRIVTQIG